MFLVSWEVSSPDAASQVSAIVRTLDMGNDGELSVPEVKAFVAKLRGQSPEVSTTPQDCAIKDLPYAPLVTGHP